MAGLPWYEIPLDGEIEAYEAIFSTGYWKWDDDSENTDLEPWDEEHNCEINPRFAVASPDEEEEIDFDQFGPLPLEDEDAINMQFVQALDSMLPPIFQTS